MKKILASMIFFLIVMISHAWAIYPNYTICPSGCDYNNLEGAFNDLETSHATLTSNVVMTISGSWSGVDTNAVSYTGVTPGSFTVTVTAAGTARTDGIYTATGAYTLSPSSSNGITISNSSLTIDGIQIVAQSSNSAMFINNYQSGLVIKNNIMVLPNVGGGDCIFQSQPRGTNYVYNNICYGHALNYQSLWSASSSSDGDGSTVVYLYNNTGYDLYDGISAANGGGNFVERNNIMLDCANACFDNLSKVTAGSNNASSDSTATNSPMTSGLSGQTSYSSYFVSLSGFNFNLAYGSPFIGEGYSSIGSFTTDIAGNTRTTPWDMGAFKYQTSGSTSTITNGVLKDATNF